jgi:tRNA A-37 threonylcarbamoyl transferase component Bud32
MGSGLDVVTSLGGYVLLRQLGEGGMGRVFLARHQLLQRDVVIKQIRPHLADRPELVRRFFAEAQAAARLRHPNVVEVIDCAHAPDGSPYLVLEYLDGLTMHDWLTATGPADPTHVALIVAQVASALAVAHAAGIVHRDIKPENLFLMEAPVNLGARLRSAGLPTNLFVKVLDFGIAKLVDGSGTRTGVALGTPAFMPPEQLQDAAAVDGRADVYALGAAVWQALTGQPLPWANHSLVEIHRLQTSEPPPDPRSYRSDLDPTVAAVVCRALAGRRDDRWPTIDAFARAFAAAVPHGDLVLAETAPALAIASAPTAVTASIVRPAHGAPPTAPPTVTPLANAVMTGPAPRQALRVGLMIGAGVVAASIGGVLLAVRGKPDRPTAQPASAAPTHDAGPVDAPVLLDASPRSEAAVPDAPLPVDATSPSTASSPTTPARHRRAEPRPGARSGSSARPSDSSGIRIIK